MCCTESTSKRVIPKRYRCFFFCTEADGWTTIVRNPTQVRKPSPTNRPRHLSHALRGKTSPLLSLLPLLSCSNGTISSCLGKIPPHQRPFLSSSLAFQFDTFSNLASPHQNPKPTFKEALLAKKPLNQPSMAKTSALRKSKTSVPADSWAQRSIPFSRNSGHMAWKGRYYKCLEMGHDQATCLASYKFCPRCRNLGHVEKICPLLSQQPTKLVNPLTHYGNLGEDLLLRDKPLSLATFVPRTASSYRDLKILQKAVVIDAKLWGDMHSTE